MVFYCNYYRACGLGLGSDGIDRAGRCKFVITSGIMTYVCQLDRN